MEAPPVHMTQFTDATTAAAAAAWHVAGQLLRQGRPSHPSELAWSFAPFCSNPDFIRFLCSIPDSPLCIGDDDIVTFSQRGVAAFAQFFANSHLIRYLDLPQLVPRLLAKVRSNGLVRTYCRKRKRVAAEHGRFLTIENKRFFLDSDGNLSISLIYFDFQKNRVKRAASCSTFCLVLIWKKFFLFMTDEKNSNQMEIAIPYKFQNAIITRVSWRL